jgi:hypothetical protein
MGLPKKKLLVLARKWKSMAGNMLVYLGVINSDR